MNLTCDQCGGRFKRLEHLTRHSRRHFQQRPFKCPFCAKQFLRKDTLKKHVATHGEEASKIYATQAALEANKVAHACSGCIKTKQRCDGQNPCGRCDKKGISCAYQPRRSDQHDDHSTDAAQSASQVAIPATESERQNWVEVPQPELGLAFQSSPLDNGSSENTRLGETSPRISNAIGISQLNLAYAQEWPIFNNAMLEPYFDQYIFEDRGFVNEFNDLPTSSGLTNMAEGPMQQLDTQSALNLEPAVMAGPSRNNILPVLLVESDLEVHTGHRSPDLSVTGSHNLSSELVTTPSLNQSAASGDCCNGRRRCSMTWFPIPSAQDEIIITTERYYHSRPLPEDVYDDMRRFYINHCLCAKAGDSAPFPRIEILDSFIQLFFEFTHPDIPLFNVSRFDTSPSSWILNAAVAGIGCHHSQISNRQLFADGLLQFVELALAENNSPELPLESSLSISQATCLYNLCQMFHGTKKELLKLQHHRNSLITQCRLHYSKGGNILARNKPQDHVGHKTNWNTWVVDESWRRLIYCTWMLECFQWIFFNMSPIIAIWELPAPLPCNDDCWNAPVSTEWPRINSSHESIAFDPGRDILALIGSSILMKDTIRSMGDFASLIAMLSSFCEGKRSDFLPIHGIRRQFAADAILERHLEYFSSLPSLPPRTSGLIPLARKILHALVILQKVNLNLLSRASGWATTTEDQDAANQELSQIFSNKEIALQLLHHAAILFRLIRNQPRPTFCDPHCLLVATIFIWSCAERIDRLRDHVYSPMDWQGRPLRIDEEMDDDVRQHWLGSDGQQAVFIAGVGILQAPEAPRLLLREAIRILNRQSSWSLIGKGIARALERILLSGTAYDRNFVEGIGDI